MSQMARISCFKYTITSKSDEYRSWINGPYSYWTLSRLLKFLSRSTTQDNNQPLNYKL